MPALIRAALPYAIALLVGFGAAWKLQAWRYGAEIAAIHQAAADATAAAATAALETTAALQAEVAAIDTAWTEELNDARTETDRLRAAVADGTRRLRIATAARPACLPGAAAGAGVDPATTAELSPEAGRAVLDLRAGIAEQHAALSACQQILREVIGKAAPMPVD